ncbi:MAG: Uncharacterised protein [Cellulomonadaceae bacterium TMED98]|nr:MAG: Uncharacterised protein [Cellulomonadaceae bacterium TMED98]
MQKPFSFSLGQFVDGDSCPRRHNRRNIGVGDLVVDHSLVAPLTGFCLLDVFFDFWDDFVVELGGFLIVAFSHGPIELDSGVVEPGFQVSHTLKRGFFCCPPRLQPFQFALPLG